MLIILRVLFVCTIFLCTIWCKSFQCEVFSIARKSCFAGVIAQDGNVIIKTCLPHLSTVLSHAHCTCSSASRSRLSCHHWCCEYTNHSCTTVTALAAIDLLIWSRTALIDMTDWSMIKALNGQNIQLVCVPIITKKTQKLQNKTKTNKK